MREGPAGNTRMQELRCRSPARLSRGRCRGACRRRRYGVEPAAAERRALAAHGGGVDVEQPFDLGVARPALGVPRSGADLDRVAVLLRRQGHAGQLVAVATDDDDRAILAERRVLLERHPRPHDLAGVGVAVHVRRVLDAHAGVDAPRRRLAAALRRAGVRLGLAHRRDDAAERAGYVQPSGHRVRVGQGRQAMGTLRTAAPQ